MNIISYAIGLNSGGGSGGNVPTAEELTFTGNDLADGAFSGKLADLVCSKYFDKISFNDITAINSFATKIYMISHVIAKIIN